MKSKNIALTILGVGTILSCGMIEKIDSNAWVTSTSRITWTKTGAAGRPSEGYFQSGLSMEKNPSSVNYIGTGAYYTKPNTQIVKNAKISGYGYTFLYYEPYSYVNSSGQTVVYKSGSAQGVEENYYAVFSKQNVSSWYHTTALNKYGWGGSTSNFITVESRPNSGSKNSYSSAGTSVDGAWDSAMGVNGLWRYTGYNQKGEPLGNPFFIMDSGGTTLDPDERQLIIQNYHGHYDYLGVKRSLAPSKYDTTAMIDDKLEAIERLKEKDIRFKDGYINYNTSSKANNVFINGGTIPTETWANVMSLSTDPRTETAFFTAHRWVGNMTSGGYRYSEITGMTAKALLQELEVSRIEVRDKGNNLVAEFNRDKYGNVSTNNYKKVVPGNTYTVKYTLYNSGEAPTTVSPSKVYAGYAINENATKNDYSSKYSYNNYTTTASATGTIGAGATKVISTQVRVPDNTWSAFRFTGYIHDDYVKAQENGVDTNDGGAIVSSVEHGDMSITSIKLQDRSGNIINDINDKNAMIPGEDYKILYTVKYTGPNRESQSTLHLNTTVTRWLPGGGSELTSKYTFTKNFNSANNGYYLLNGQEFTFSTDFITFEIPRVSTSVTLSTNNSSTNSNTSNDKASKNWYYDYDVKVSNVKVYNTNERPTQNGTITLGVKYDIDVIAPNQLPYFETDLKTHITLPNGSVVSFTDHVGKGSNPDITHEIQVPVSVITSGSKNLNVTVLANADRKFWENDLTTQSNNKGSNYAVQLPPVNPTTTEGCPIYNPIVYFNVRHDTNSFSGSSKSWSKFDNSGSYSFYKFNNTSKSATSKTYTETYEITSVKFKSKDTTDKGYGSNGWVELTTSDKKNAIIKAGYGYELQIEVKYNTNALTNQPNAYHTVNSSSSYGTKVTNLNHKANIYKDIYVKTSDNKILSATGMYGTVSAFNVSVVQSDNNTTILRYTMKNTTQNGISIPMKIYTSENRTDGTETLKVWTPTITGVGNATKPNTSLCDQKMGLSFKIQGSMYDDNQDNIIQ